MNVFTITPTQSYLFCLFLICGTRALSDFVTFEPSYFEVECCGREAAFGTYL